VEWVGAERHRAIEEAIGAVGHERLKPIKEALPAEFTYEEIRLVVAGWKKREETK
jgi:ATP-dependent DNA helicase RecQ